LPAFPSPSLPIRFAAFDFIALFNPLLPVKFHRRSFRSALRPNQFAVLLIRFAAIFDSRKISLVAVHRFVSTVIVFLPLPDQLN
jgi:hypothetical protein